MRSSRLLHLAVVLPSFIWSDWFLLTAWQRWLWSLRCSLICPAFIDAEDAESNFTAMDWQSPLLYALAPIAFLAAYWLMLRLSGTIISKRAVR